MRDSIDARFRRKLFAVVAFSGLVAIWSSPAFAQGPDAAALLKRLDALEAGQRAIQKQLDDISALLQGLRTPPAQAGPVEDVQGRDLRVSLTNAATRGQASARVVLIEFSDFQCPFCGRYVRETYAELQREFVDTGKVRYAFRSFPLESIHPLAFKAAEAGECAREQGKFWEMHDRLFADQQALAPSDLLKHGQALGMDDAKFQTCFEGTVTARIKADQAEAVRLGLTGTPTFLVGEAQPDGTVKVLQKIVGAQPYATFRAILQAVLIAPPAAPK
jgi:protein-disulfide isomerase